MLTNKVTLSAVPHLLNHIGLDFNAQEARE